MTPQDFDIASLAALVAAGGRKRHDSPAALVLKQDLAPVEGRDAVFFPPTYAAAKDRKDASPYNISELSDGTKVAAIDSVGSHANRLEPIFGMEGYEGLVPRVEVEVSEAPGIPVKRIPLLEIGHRLADALVRGTDAQELVEQAFNAASQGDLGKIAAMAPTTVLFGAWDSRKTRVKLKRLLSGRIDAHDVSELKRSAQYVAPLDYKTIGLDLDKDSKTALEKETDAKESMPGKLSEGGYAGVPSVGVHGGIVARGAVRRTMVLNLTAIGHLSSRAPVDPVRLREYIMGLGLVAMTAPVDLDLRAGCHLVHEGPGTFEIVLQDGTRTSIPLDHDMAVEWAKGAAERFRDGLTDRTWEHTWTIDRVKLSSQVKASLTGDDGAKPAKKKTESSEEAA